MALELSLANILANIVTKFGNTELNYISDFKMEGDYHFQYSFTFLFTRFLKQNKVVY